MADCPRCHLTNLPESRYCDCGYDLHLPAAMQASQMRKPPGHGSTLRTIGVALLVGVALIWTFCLMALRQNNLMGLIILWMLPGSVIAVVIGLILIAAR